MSRVIRPEEIKVTKNWLKVVLSNDYKDKNGVKGSLYFPIDNAKELMDSGGFCVSLSGSDEGCEYSSIKVSTSKNFIRYKLNGVGNDFSDFYVPKDLDEEVLEVDLSMGVKG